MSMKCGAMRSVPTVRKVRKVRKIRKVMPALVMLLMGCSASHRSAREAAPLNEPRCGDDHCDAAEGGANCPSDCLDLEWVAIEGGSFRMGSEEGRDNERPLHEVSLPAFEILRQEVTDGDYRQCVNAEACTEPRFDRGNDLVQPQYCTWLAEGREDHPINCIDWTQARAFCQWIGARLPTEAEWEYAARGRGRDVPYPWGTAPPTCSLAIMGVAPVFVGCREERTFPVCSRPRGNTPQGLCDMAGGVIEWVEDEGHESYEGAPSDGSAWVDSESPTTRIARGGSLATWDVAFLRTTLRFAFEPGTPRYVVGIRCAR